MVGWLCEQGWCSAKGEAGETKLGRERENALFLGLNNNNTTTMDWDALAAGLPVSFGKQVVKKKDTFERIETTKRDETKGDGLLTPLEAGATPAVVDNVETTEIRRLPVSDSDEDDNDDDRDFVELKEGSDLPVTHEVAMKDHGKVSSTPDNHSVIIETKHDQFKTVSALSIDPSGTRFVSGSYDYDAKLWDFGGMSSEFKPFRSWEIKEGHQVGLYLTTFADDLLELTSDLS